MCSPSRSQKTAASASRQDSSSKQATSLLTPSVLLAGIAWLSVMLHLLILGGYSLGKINLGHALVANGTVNALLCLTVATMWWRR
jgi:hypothetical protein